MKYFDYDEDEWQQHLDDIEGEELDDEDEDDESEEEDSDDS